MERGHIFILHYSQEIQFMFIEMWSSGLNKLDILFFSCLLNPMHGFLLRNVREGLVYFMAWGQPLNKIQNHVTQWPFHWNSMSSSRRENYILEDKVLLYIHGPFLFFLYKKCWKLVIQNLSLSLWIPWNSSSLNLF